jgi:hypothetical protein
MPQTHSNATRTRPQPVPVGVFLVPTHRPRGLAVASLDLADWHGLTPASIGYLVCRYTRPGDMVLDLDEHPTVTEATRYLHRVPARLATDGTGQRVAPQPPPTGAPFPRQFRRGAWDGAGLMLVTLPRAGLCSLDLHGMTVAMSTWRLLLRPGGFLLTAVTARRNQARSIGHRSTIITAARAAGLIYHQHIPVVLVPLPEPQPRSEPDPYADGGPLLLAGRHVPIHRDLLAFATTATGSEATRG